MDPTIGELFLFDYGVSHWIKYHPSIWLWLSALATPIVVFTNIIEIKNYDGYDATGKYMECIFYIIFSPFIGMLFAGAGLYLALPITLAIGPFWLLAKGIKFLKETKIDDLRLFKPHKGYYDAEFDVWFKSKEQANGLTRIGRKLYAENKKRKGHTDVIQLY